MRELAIGAIASDGERVLDAETIRILGVLPSQIEAITHKQAHEMERLEHLYRGNRVPLDVHGRTLILVDDGMATGSTMRVAVIALRRKDPLEIIAAVPVASDEACRQVDNEADSVVCLYRPEEFFAVGQWYRDFTQVGDAEVRNLLDQTREARF